MRRLKPCRPARVIVNSRLRLAQQYRTTTARPQQAAPYYCSLGNASRSGDMRRSLIIWWRRRELRHLLPATKSLTRRNLLITKQNQQDAVSTQMANTVAFGYTEGYTTLSFLGSSVLLHRALYLAADLIQRAFSANKTDRRGATNTAAALNTATVGGSKCLFSILC